ncbi:MAG: SRPBCC family protein [Thermoplasmata archaeon]|nr:SRPBCC family protein [Thermoplasmata archaeon]
MAEYAEEGVFPIPRALLWSFIEQHADPATVVKIHPDIVSQTVVSRTGDELVVDRGLKFRKAVLHAHWKLTAQRPDSYRWEILDGNGPILPGSHMINTYSEVAGGTRIVSRGDVRILKVPGFLTKRVIKGVFRDIDRQDRAFLHLPPE